MPIKTHMKKSGRKRVFDQEEGRHGRLNEAAREPFRSEGASLTPGTAGLTDPVKARQSHRAEIVTQNRRRRQLGSLQKVFTGRKQPG